MAILLMGLGFLYVRKGIDQKDSIRVSLGAIIFVYTLIIKVTDMWQEQLFDGKEMTGFTIAIYGALLLGIVVYIRSEWNVTGPAENLISKSNDHVIDNIGDELSED